MRSRTSEDGSAAGIHDTERPPAGAPLPGQPGGLGSMPTAPDPFGPEPASAVVAHGEATKIGPPPDPGRLAPPVPGSERKLPVPKLSAAAPQSERKLPASPAGHGELAPRERKIPAAPSSGRLVAAPPAPPAAPPVPPIARAATMVGGAAVPATASPAAPPVASPPAPPARPPPMMRPPTPGFAFSPSGVTKPGIPGSDPSMRASSASVVDPALLTRVCTSCGERYPADFLVCPRDATPLVDDVAPGEEVDPLVGKLIGETYQIVRVVGEGGMGRVYEARHLRLKERRFAVKTLHADLARNPEHAARFLREAESASSISHPNVIDVFDVHHLPDGIPYFVAELLEGEELADHVETKGALEPRMAVSVGRQICLALAAAHERGIVHRDMKPENVFVLKTPPSGLGAGEQKLAIKVLDFGISKAGGTERTHLTRTGVIMGTPSYMAPEQARGKQVDARADVYSVGAVLYYAITGKRPFDSDDPTTTISMVLTQDPTRPREIDPKIPEALELVVQRAMAKDVRDRYQTMLDLERALATALGEQQRTSLPVPGGMSVPPAAGNEEQLSITASGRAFDMAKAMLAGPSGQNAMQIAKDARLARPTIAATSGVLGAWFVFGTTDALAGLVRVLHDGEITTTECVLLVVGCLVAASTPVALYVMHVKKVIWPNSVRAVQLAHDLKRTASAALVTYGGLAITSRIIYSVFARHSKVLSSGVWDIVFFLVSIIAAATVGGAGPLLRNMRRRKRS
jgi:serine/threonine-protein kinase